MSKSAIGNAKECRKHALACLRLAETSTLPQAREHFAKLGKTWLKLAGDLQALRDTLEEPKSRRRTFNRSHPRHCGIATMSALGLKRKPFAAPLDVRFAPKADVRRARSKSPLCAN